MLLSGPPLQISDDEGKLLLDLDFLSVTMEPVMSRTLSTIPAEQLLQIVDYLLLPDQSMLSRTCRSLNVFLTPVVWRDIELHYSGTHEGLAVEEEIDAMKYEDPLERKTEALNPRDEYPYQHLVYKPSSRKYSQPHFDCQGWRSCWPSRRFRSFARATNNCNRRNNQFGKEELLISVPKITSPERWCLLASHVRSLCISIGVDEEVVSVIASMKNLTSLELIGHPLKEGHMPTSSEVKLPRLKNLKLRGYFSAALIRQFCSNAEHIEFLNLGLLATLTDDKAYEETLLAGNDSSTPVSDKKAEWYQEHGAEAMANAVETKDVRDLVVTFDTVAHDRRTWAPHSPIWLPRSLPSQFASLTHLHLVKPYTGTTGSYFDHDHFLSLPHRYEQVLCKEWTLLLKGVAGTLKELILEHRIPVEQGDTVGDGEALPMAKGSEGRANWASLAPTGSPDRGDELFCQSVLRLLIERSDMFANLRYLALRGIQIRGISMDDKSEKVPGQDGLPDNDAILRNTYPDCEIELYDKAYPIHAYAGYVYQKWPINRIEAMQDEGDGLLYNEQFFNDYKRRFGPQWRVPR